MSKREERRKLAVYIFAVTIVISTIFLTINMTDYLGLLESMEAMEFSLDDMSHSLEDNMVKMSLTFVISNPTTYTRLKLSSIQCQIYLIIDGVESYIGTTAYAPPQDAPLQPYEEKLFEVVLKVPKGINDELLNAPLASELDWRVRCVVNLVTPIRKYFHRINLYPTSRLVD